MRITDRIHRSLHAVKTSDRLIAPRWVCELVPPLRGVFLDGEENRKALRSLRLQWVARTITFAMQTAAVSFAYRYFPAQHLLEAVSAPARIGQVGTSLAVFSVGAASAQTVNWFQRKSFSRFATRVAIQTDLLIRDLRSRSRAQWEADGGDLDRLRAVPNEMQEAVHGPWRRSANNSAVLVGSLAGAVAAMGIGGLAMVATTLPVVGVGAVIAVHLRRQEREQADRSAAAKKDRADYEVPRTTRGGLESLRGLGLDLKATEAHGAMLYAKEVEAQRTRKIATDNMDMFWFTVREAFFVCGIVVAALAGLPSAVLGGISFAAGQVSTTLSTLTRDRPVLFDAAERSTLVRRVEQKCRLFEFQRRAQLREGSRPGDREWDGTVTVRDLVLPRPDGHSEQFSLVLEPGTITVVAGPNGSGKTTTMRVLDQQFVPLEGDVIYGDVSSRFMDPADVQRQAVLITPQTDPRLAIDHLRGFDRVERWRALRAVGFSKAQATAIAGKIDARTPLSTGQETRLCMLSLLFGKPKLVLLDEFDVWLDPRGQDTLIRLVQGLRARGSTIVAASNTTVRFLGVADRFVMLGPRNEIVADGDPKTLVLPHVTPAKCGSCNAPEVHKWVQGVDQFTPLRAARGNEPQHVTGVRSFDGGFASR